LEHNSVDLITLDVTMPGLDGPTWLNSRRHAGLGVPVVIVSECGPARAGAILGALENGAQDYIEKSTINSPDFAEKLLAISKSYRLQVLTGAPVLRVPPTRSMVRRDRPDLILVGASTGGTEAVMRLLESMPSDAPPIVIVQHISPFFARAFAHRVAQHAHLQVGVCAEGTLLEAGHVYVADDDRHIGVGGRKGRLSIVRSDGPPINRHRPSVDFLFKSAAVLSNVHVSAVLLTGMGSDGAEGMRELHDRGAVTFCQDERSCVVFGMPREAIALGAADVIASPEEIRYQLEWQLAHSNASR
jgi:two-component system chemotaxis response regulator CheB